MLAAAIPARYLLTLMGFFACYTGWIYNDCVSVSLDTAGTNLSCLFVFSVDMFKLSFTHPSPVSHLLQVLVGPTQLSLLAPQLVWAMLTMSIHLALIRSGPVSYCSCSFSRLANCILLCMLTLFAFDYPCFVFGRWSLVLGRLSFFGGLSFGIRLGTAPARSSHLQTP